jgi:hypothetical protein
MDFAATAASCLHAGRESNWPGGIRFDIEGNLALRYLLLDEAIFATMPKRLLAGGLSKQ